MDLDRAHQIAREKGVNPVVYWVVRAFLQPFFHVYFRLRRIGVQRIPAAGPVLIAANHRSFADPFLIGVCLRRPLRFVAKQELFDRRWKARLLLALGAFPIRRGESDEQAMETARLILEGGGAVGIFPEGTRVRPGPLGQPKRGVGRLALETGAVVVPVAITGTDDIRRGWLVRPRSVRIRSGRPLTFPRPLDGGIATHLAEEVSARVWSCVQLQWEWLGGAAPVRAAAVVGAGSWGTATSILFSRGGASVQLGCRTASQTATLADTRTNRRYLPDVALPPTVTPVTVAGLALADVDVVCLAVPSRALPGALAEVMPRLPEDAGILLLTKGLVPDGSLPEQCVSAHAGGRPVAILGGPAHAREACAGEAGLVVASRDPLFRARLVRAFEAAGVHCEASDDPVGVQFAACAKNAATLAAGNGLAGGVNAAGLAAGRVYAECHALARAHGAGEHSFAGLAGAGDLVASVLASHSRNRRAGEMLAEGATVAEIEQTLGQAAESLDLIPLLAGVARVTGIRAPATAALAALIEQRSGPPLSAGIRQAA